MPIHPINPAAELLKIRQKDGTYYHAVACFNVINSCCWFSKIDESNAMEMLETFPRRELCRLYDMRGGIDACRSLARAIEECVGYHTLAMSILSEKTNHLIIINNEDGICGSKGIRIINL